MLDADSLLALSTPLPASLAIKPLTIKIPPALAGCGQARLQIDGSEDSHTFLLIQYYVI